MSWPIESDYFEAVQNPRVAFTDAELKAGSVTLTPLGLPKPITGAFASVYQINCGSRRWAVRCFLRDFADQQKRYTAISEHLRRINLPYTVGFEFQREGILVCGKRYPILKMEWVDGDSLSGYIAKHLHTPKALSELAREWVEMLATLGAHGVAHGDLQHGNILVSNGRLRLIDYDGMYVPALQGMASHEEGHRNYQHPSRRSSDFNACIDNFSAWVVFLSLACVSIDPRLWQLLNGGDECLLFRREDFQQPNQSRAIDALERSGKAELAALAYRLKSLLPLPLSAIPSLDQNVVHSPHGTTSQTAGGSGGGPQPSWLADHLPTSTPKDTDSQQLLDPTPPAVAPASTASASWIIDHLVGSEPAIAPFTGVSLRLERSVFFVCVLLLLLSCYATFFYWPSVVLILLTTLACVGLAAGFLRWRYAQLPAVIELHRIRSQFSVVEKGLHEQEQRVAQLEVSRAKLLEPLVKIDSEFRGLPRDLRSLKAAAVDRYNVQLAKLHVQLQEFDWKEAAELRSLDDRIGNEMNRLRQELVRIDQAEMAELQQLNAVVTRNHAAYVMQNARLESASISGIGAKLKAALRDHGVITAADIDSRIEGIPGIGPTKAANLQAWRHHVEQLARSSAPTPSALEVTTTRNRFSTARTPVAARLNGLQQQLSIDRQGVLDRFASARRQVELQRQRAKQRWEADTASETMRINGRAEDLKRQFERVRKSVESEEQTLKLDEATLRQGIFQLKLELGTLERDRLRYRSVRFSRYLKHIASL
jgi:serine/threonine protein kinase